MNSKSIYLLPIIAVAIFVLSACNNDSQSPGIEYMPDMYRTPSIEEYVDYGEIRDRIVDSIAHRVSAMVPPTGTIPYSSDPTMVQFNFPYPYPNTEQGYKDATNNLKNPIPFSEGVYNEGKTIFGKFCVHCHGPKGQGQGSIVATGAFPPPPAYNRIANLTEGKMFHTLMYGKGNMGSHSSQLDKHELWTVIHYVNSLRDEKYDFKSASKLEAVNDNSATEESEQSTD